MENENQAITSKMEENHVLDEAPCVYSTDEAKAMVLERGREIKAGRVKMIPHDEVMREMEPSQWDITTDSESQCNGDFILFERQNQFQIE